MLNYIGSIYRPPSEANSIIIQATVGCSHNSCTFCEMYREKQFRVKPLDLVLKDIELAGKYYPDSRRLFIADGDALVAPQNYLVTLLDKIETAIPRVRRVGIYANLNSIEGKSLEELKELKAKGLGIVYFGLESGHDLTLEKINKKASFERLLAAGKKIKAAGIKLSVTVLLGIAGKNESLIHAEDTGKLLTAMNPDFVGVLTLTVTPGTKLYQELRAGTFALPTSLEMLNELGVMLSNTTLSDGYFHANHASNYLPLSLHLPDDKEQGLAMINKALQGNISLKPEYLRGL